MSSRFKKSRVEPLLLDAQVMDAAATSRAIDCDGYSYIRLHINFARSAGTAVIINPLGALYDEKGALSSGVLTTFNEVDDGAGSDEDLGKSVSANDIWVTQPFDIRGLARLKLKFTVTSGGTSDILTVSGVMYSE